MDLWADSDHADWSKTRESTSAAAGDHLLRFALSTQTVVSFQLRESPEFYAIVKATSMVMCAKEMARGLGQK